MNKLKAVNAILQYNIIMLGITTIILSYVTYYNQENFGGNYFDVICAATRAIKALIII